MNSIFKRNGLSSSYVWITAITAMVMALMPDSAIAATAGTMIQSTADNLVSFPKLISAISYTMGAAFVGLGVYKMRDWSNSPQQTKISEPFKFLGAGGLLVAAPAFAAVLNSTIGIDASVDGITTTSVGGVFTDSEGDPLDLTVLGNGLDAMVIRLVADITGPMTNLMLGFAYVAGALLSVVGLNRLTKSSQEGPRGPSGMGTMGTFVASAILLSSSQVMGVFTETIFGSAATDVAVYTEILGLSASVPVNHAENVISAILGFMLIIGTISFLRGIFVLRGFAEGNSQMTLMGGLSHIIAGILAVNLGQFMNIIQATLNISPSATGVAINFA